MTVVSAGAPSAETLTLIRCLTQANREAITDNTALSEAALEAGVPAAALAAGVDGLKAALDNVLNIPVGEMFKAACLKHPNSDGKPTTGEETLALTLAPMVVESSHHPTITATWAAISLALRLTVELSLEINGVQLLFEDHRVLGARTGTSLGKVKVSLFTKDAAVVLGTPEFRLPGELRFASAAAFPKRS